MIYTVRVEAEMYIDVEIDDGGKSVPDQQIVMGAAAVFNTIDPGEFMKRAVWSDAQAHIIDRKEQEECTLS